MSILKIKSGSGINVNANPSDKSLTIQTEVPLPTSSNPLSVERGGTGVANLDVEIQALKEALVNAINGGNSGIGNVTVIGNEMIFNKKVYITSSGQWTAPKTGVYKFRLGGGGSATILNNNAISYIGTPGYYEEGFVHLQKNEIVNIQIGAGGGTNNNGGDPGSTSISTTNFSLTALRANTNYMIQASTGGNVSISDLYHSFINLEDVQGLPGKITHAPDSDNLGTAGKVSIEWFE